MAAVRFIRNIQLQVTFDGEETMVPFASGDIYNATKIEVDAEGYSNIFMPDGSVINGVGQGVFENMGKNVPVVQVEVVEAVEAEEIEVEEKPVEVALLDGQMRSEEPNDDYGNAEPFAATNE